MDFKPHATITRTVCIFLKITILFAAIAALAGCYGLCSHLVFASHEPQNNTMRPSDLVAGIIALLQCVISIPTAVIFLLWTYRSNKNLRSLSGRSMVFTPGWSVGWYFIPIANLYTPYRAMREIWNVSHGTEAVGHAVVRWWWTLWLTSNILARIFNSLVKHAEAVSSSMASAITYVVSNGSDIALNILALTMVRRIAAAYSRNIVEPAIPSTTN